MLCRTLSLFPRVPKVSGSIVRSRVEHSLGSFTDTNQPANHKGHEVSRRPWFQRFPSRDFVSFVAIAFESSPRAFITAGGIRPTPPKAARASSVRQPAIQKAVATGYCSGAVADREKARS